MTYKETLFFVGKCLTITHNEHNRILVQKEIKSGNLNWDDVVKLSTKHYVFPALYCNLKRVDFLHYLPEELVNYMKHVADLNRERNLQILAQAKEINGLLLANGITPVFLKGTGNLLEDLYEDIAERMVGDIDFIVDKNTADKTLKILSENQYTRLTKPIKQLGYIKHYPRLVKNGRINAIEVHLEMTLEKFSSVFNYQVIKPNLRKKDVFTLLSHKHQITHTIINKQLNDYGYLHKNIALRNYYDLYLLSFKANTLKSIGEFPRIFNQLNSFLALASLTFPSTQSILFEENSSVIHYQNSVLKLLGTPEKHKNRNRYLRFHSLTKIRIKLLIKVLYSKKHFLYVLSKLSTLNWYKRRLGIKPTP
jgi:hypothetical protein